MLGASEITELLKRHGLEARRSLGQNFVADPNVVARIVEHAGVGPGDHVIEVGPGVGSLSTAILEAGATLTAIEKDPRMLPVLEEVLSSVPGASLAQGTGSEVVLGDALTLDWPEVIGREPARLVANLPYNVAVPIILTVLEEAPNVNPLVVMVQREVAERLVASPGGKTIGVPTLKVAWYASAKIVMKVPPTVFIPQPRVDSAVVRFDRHGKPASNPEPVFQMLERAYGQRRKMLRRSLNGLVSAQQFDRAGIDSASRPETLDLSDWVRLVTAAR